MFDGTYFRHENCLMLILDNQTNRAVSWDYVSKENYASACRMFQWLKDGGVVPTAITIDGNISIIRALKSVWPDIIIQRCLYHIQRQGLAWLRRYPRLEAARCLRRLLLTVTDILCSEQRDEFIGRFLDWEEQYGQSVIELPTNDKVFSDLQRTRSLITHALPDMFHYLNDSRIAPTTNRIEGYFSNLKGRYRQHRGLSKIHRQNYLSWYIYLKNSD